MPFYNGGQKLLEYLASEIQEQRDRTKRENAGIERCLELHQGSVQRHLANLRRCTPAFLQSQSGRILFRLLGATGLPFSPQRLRDLVTRYHLALGDVIHAPLN